MANELRPLYADVDGFHDKARALETLAGQIARLGIRASEALEKMMVFLAHIEWDEAAMGKLQLEHAISKAASYEHRRIKALTRSRRNVETLKKKGICR